MAKRKTKTEIEQENTNDVQPDSPDPVDGGNEQTADTVEPTESDAVELENGSEQEQMPNGENTNDQPDGETADSGDGQGTDESHADGDEPDQAEPPAPECPRCLKPLHNPVPLGTNVQDYHGTMKGREFSQIIRRRFKCEKCGRVFISTEYK